MDNCSCVDIDIEDPIECIEDTYRISIKEHKFIECGCIIQKGRKYNRIKGKFEGKLETFKTCFDCVTVRRSFFCDGFEFYNMWDMLKDHIDEMCGDISSDCIVRLTKAAKDKVCDMIEEYWEDNWDEEEDD